jgi:hypothetical protein
MHWIEIIAEDRIQEAIESGVFDNLPGKGKPLDLDEYFNTPANERVGMSLLKNARFVPVEVELLKEIELLEKAVTACSDPLKRRHLAQRLQQTRVSLNMLIERRRITVRSSEI